MKILLTAFDPFGGSNVNPAEEAVKRVRDTIDGAQIVKLTVPTVFKKSIETVAAAMDREKPDVVVCIGQAGGRFGITPERVAVNNDDARIKDNEGNQPVDTPIFEDGDTAYFSSLPIKAMVKAIKDAGLPSSVSNTAGSFVCNHLMYGVLYHIKKSHPNTRGGFVHVPYIPEQVVDLPDKPAMSTEDITRGLEAALAAIVANDTDIKAVGGKLH